MEDFKLYLNDLYIMNGALRVQRYTSDYDESFTVNVGGIYIPTKAMMQSLDLDNNNYDILLCNEQINGLLISDADWVDLFDDGSARYCAAIAAMPSDNAGIDKILNVHYEKSLKVYVLTNTVNSMLSTAETMIEMFKKVFLYIGIGFAVFAALMMFNFIAVSINMKKREIGILRAVGARSSDVFGIFFNESLIITLINYVISVAVTLFAVFGINRLLRNEVGLIITLLHFGVRQLLLMLGVSLLVAFVASFFPVYRIAKKRPIDAIRG